MMLCSQFLLNSIIIKIRDVTNIYLPEHLTSTKYSTKLLGRLLTFLKVLIDYISFLKKK